MEASPYHIDGVGIELVESHKDLGVTVDRQLKFHSHVSKRLGFLQSLTSNILGCTLNRSSSFLMSIYKSHIRPKLEYGSCLWNMGFVGDMRRMERLQRRWTRSVSGLENLPYDQRLSRLDLFSFKGRLLRADMIMVWKIMHGECAIRPNDIFEMDSSNRTRGHPLKIKVNRTNLSVRSRYFSSRVINPWNALSSEAVLANSLDSFKGRLHRDLGSKLFEYFE